MQDLSALTPPLLVCLVVIIAIIAFLRYEIGRSRPDQAAPGDEISASAEKPDAAEDRERFDGDAAPHAPGGDWRPGH